MVVILASAFFFWSRCRCRVGEIQIGKDGDDGDSACDEHVSLIHHGGSSVEVIEA